MADNKRHVVVVCGYGCHLRDPEGRPTPLLPYLDRVGAFIRKHNPELAVFCGGYTQRKSAPGVSEAGLMSDYLDHEQTVGFGNTTEFVITRSSYTTYGNIQHAAQRIWEFGPRDDKYRITIFCEATRAANVTMLARHFLLPFVNTIDDITVETASWERADPFKQAGNLIYNKLAITYPWLGLAERERRRRIRRSRFI